MKIKILILTLFLFNQLLNAQNKYKTELHSGINVIQALNENEDIDTSLNYIKVPGFQAGFNTERKLGKHFTFGTGAEFLILKYAYKDIAYDYFTIDETLALLDFKNKDYNIQIPVFIKYFPLKEKLINPYLKIAITNKFFIKSKYELYNYRIDKEDLNEVEILFKDFFLKMIETENESNFSEIERKYQNFISLSAGFSTNIHKNIFAGFNISCHFYPMTLKYFKVGMPLSAGVFAGFNF